MTERKEFFFLQRPPIFKVKISGQNPCLPNRAFQEMGFSATDSHGG